MGPTEFEELARQVFESLGYAVTMTKQSGDQGVDLVLNKGDERSIAQCKRFRGQVGQSVVRDFYGATIHEDARRGYLVTTGTFSLPAQSWALGKNLVLVDGVDLMAVLADRHIEFDAPPIDSGATSESLDTRIKAVLDDNNLLRILILGQPPPGHGYQEVMNALQSLLSLSRDQVRWIDGGRSLIKPMEYAAMFTNRSDGDLVFLEDLQARNLPFVCDAATGQIDVTLGRGLRSRTVPLSLPRVHICATVWDLRAIQSLTARQKRDLSDNFSIQVRSDQLRWSEPAGPLS